MAFKNWFKWFWDSVYLASGFYIMIVVILGFMTFGDFNSVFGNIVWNMGVIGTPVVLLLSGIRFLKLRKKKDELNPPRSSH